MPTAVLFHCAGLSHSQTLLTSAWHKMSKALVFIDSGQSFVTSMFHICILLSGLLSALVFVFVVVVVVVVVQGLFFVLFLSQETCDTNTEKY